MAESSTMASAAAANPGRSSGFLITVDNAEKARWKRAAAAAGVTMAEYVRRAVRLADEAPTAVEIVAAKRLAVEVNAAAARIEASLDRTLARLDHLLDPAVEQQRRDDILAEIERGDVYLDLDALVGAAR
ncbi:MAG: hypothetical protein M3N26_04420 [Pseudomonadota bacterium]|nr:hypothetical protein [Pseudomonadota bacterium]